MPIIDIIIVYVWSTDKFTERARAGKLVGGVSKLTLQSSISLVFLNSEVLSKSIYRSLGCK